MVKKIWEIETKLAAFPEKIKKQPQVSKLDGRCIWKERELYEVKHEAPALLHEAQGWPASSPQSTARAPQSALSIDLINRSIPLSDANSWIEVSKAENFAEIAAMSTSRTFEKVTTAWSFWHALHSSAQYGGSDKFRSITNRYKQAAEQAEYSAAHTPPPPVVRDFIYLKHKCVGLDWQIFCRRRQILWSLHLSKQRNNGGFTDADRDLLADSLREFLAS